MEGHTHNGGTGQHNGGTGQRSIWRDRYGSRSRSIWRDRSDRYEIDMEGLDMEGDSIWRETRYGGTGQIDMEGQVK